jgi:hypothetical protein
MEIEVKDLATGVVYRTNPCRDVAYFQQQLMADLGGMLSSWGPADQKRLESVPNCIQEMGKAYACMCRFMALAVDPLLKSPIECARASGFFDVHPVVQQLILEQYARLCLGAFWAGIRSAVLMHEQPPLLVTLARAGHQLLHDILTEDALRRAPQPTINKPVESGHPIDRARDQLVQEMLSEEDRKFRESIESDIAHVGERPLSVTDHKKTLVLPEGHESKSVERIYHDRDHSVAGAANDDTPRTV